MDLCRPSVPDGIAPIVAYRAWRYGVGHRFGVLDPVSQGVADGGSEWDGAGSRWVVASCPTLDPHPAPDEACSCGFYATKELSTLRAMFHHESAGSVLGKIWLAGKIVEHELGYRGELARIVELNPWQGTERLIARLAKRIGVPLGDRVSTGAWSPDHDPSSPQRPLRSWVRGAGWERALSFTVRLAA
jgi:hypothetical protein